MTVPKAVEKYVQNLFPMKVRIKNIDVKRVCEINDYIVVRVKVRVKDDYLDDYLEEEDIVIIDVSSVEDGHYLLTSHLGCYYGLKLNQEEIDELAEFLLDRAH